MRTLRKKAKQRITRKKYLRKLHDKYPNCIHDSVDKGKFGENNITYGEMNYNGIDLLYEYVKKNFPDVSTFIDVGSGRGKLCIHMSSFPQIKKSIGIEIVKERHEDALDLLNTTASSYSKKIKFFNDDIFNIDLTSNIYKSGTVFVWWSNLCFNQDITDRIYEKLQTELPSGSVIFCSKKNTQHQPFDSIKIPMSWSQNSEVYAYKRL